MWLQDWRIFRCLRQLNPIHWGDHERVHVMVVWSWSQMIGKRISASSWDGTLFWPVTWRRRCLLLVMEMVMLLLLMVMMLKRSRVRWSHHQMLVQGVAHGGRALTVPRVTHPQVWSVMMWMTTWDWGRDQSRCGCRAHISLYTQGNQVLAQAGSLVYSSFRTRWAQDACVSHSDERTTHAISTSAQHNQIFVWIRLNICIIILIIWRVSVNRTRQRAERDV